MTSNNDDNNNNNNYNSNNNNTPIVSWFVWCSQVLDEFYQNLQSVGVSAVTGEGMDDFFSVSTSILLTFINMHTYEEAFYR